MTELLLDSLAAWRLVRLAQRDEITRVARNRITGWTIRRDHPQIRYLLSCVHCLGIHGAAFVLVVKHLPGGRGLRNLLAVAGAVSLWGEVEPKATETDSPS